MNAKDRSATIVVEAPGVVFDTTDIYRRISRDRIEAVRQDGAGAPLILDLACDCPVSTFVENNGYLVVDIGDPVGPPPAARAVGRPRLASGLLPYRFRPEPVAAPEPDRVELPLAPAMPRRKLRPPVLQPSADLRIAAPDAIVDVSLMERKLAEQIGRALDQGLIDPSQPDGPAAAQGERQEDEGQHSAEGGSVPGGPPAPGHDSAEDVKPGEPNFTVRTAIDRDLSGVANTLASREASRCWPPGSVAIADWTTGQGFAAETGFWRTRLVGELDRVDRKAALALARTYLYFGFGAEADQVLELVSPQTDETRRLRALGRIIDGRKPGDDNPFADQLRCDGDQALWAALSVPAGLDRANQDAIVRAVLRLPATIREHVGSDAARRLAKAGHAERAATILRGIGRVAEPSSPGQLLAAAATADLHGHSDKAEANRETVARGNSALSSEALVELIDGQLAARGSVAPDLPDLAAAYATQHRHDGDGPVLRRAHALALALDGRFDDAFAALRDIDETDGPTAAPALRADLLGLLTDRADDITFLDHALSQLEGDAAALPDALGNALAARLLGLGFSRQAVRVLAGSEHNPAPAERRYLRAEAALGEGLPHEAMVALLGLSDPRAERLRAEALLMRQDHDLAAPLLLETGQDAAAARSFWLADNTGAIPGDSATPYAEVSGLTRRLESEQPGIGALTPLARARALLSDSDSARNEIGALLANLPPLDPPE
ncbi:MAG: hypothetical protein KDK24_19380 [Pseudooceanicola sp.]|nr:hypothetical protein [Pseudooceanicola sp.]